MGKNKIYFLIKYNCCDGLVETNKIVNTLEEALQFAEEYKKYNDNNKYIEIFMVTRKRFKKELESIFVWFN